MPDKRQSCRVMPTRLCPQSYGSCGDRPCARFESDDEEPWRGEKDDPLRSERTGFAEGDRVEWDEVVEGGVVVIPAGRGTVTIPNDGGFVWIAPDEPTHAPILRHTDVRHAD